MDGINLTVDKPEIVSGSPFGPCAMLPGDFLWKRQRTLSFVSLDGGNVTTVSPDREVLLGDGSLYRRVYLYERLASGVYSMTTGVYPRVMEAVRFRVEDGKITVIHAEPNLEAL